MARDFSAFNSGRDFSAFSEPTPDFRANTRKFAPTVTQGPTVGVGPQGPIAPAGYVPPELKASPESGSAGSLASLFDLAGVTPVEDEEVRGFGGSIGQVIANAGIELGRGIPEFLASTMDVVADPSRGADFITELVKFGPHQGSTVQKAIGSADPKYKDQIPLGGSLSFPPAEETEEVAAARRELRTRPLSPFFAAGLGAGVVRGGKKAAGFVKDKIGQRRATVEPKAPEIESFPERPPIPREGPIESAVGRTVEVTNKSGPRVRKLPQENIEQQFTLVNRELWDDIPNRGPFNTVTVGELVTDPKMRKVLGVDEYSAIANTPVMFKPDVHTTIGGGAAFRRPKSTTPDVAREQLKRGTPPGIIVIGPKTVPANLMHEVSHVNRMLKGRTFDGKTEELSAGKLTQHIIDRAEGELHGVNRQRPVVQPELTVEKAKVSDQTSDLGRIPQDKVAGSTEGVFEQRRSERPVQQVAVQKPFQRVKPPIPRDTPIEGTVGPRNQRTRLKPSDEYKTITEYQADIERIGKLNAKEFGWPDTESALRVEGAKHKTGEDFSLALEAKWDAIPKDRRTGLLEWDLNADGLRDYMPQGLETPIFRDQSAQPIKPPLPRTTPIEPTVGPKPTPKRDLSAFEEKKVEKPPVKVKVFQGRSRKGLTEFTNPDGVAWGTSERSVAEEFFADKRTVTFPNAKPPRQESMVHGEVYELEFSFKNPKTIPIKETLWDRAKEAEAIKLAKDGGHDGLIIEHGGRKDYVAFNKSQVRQVRAAKPTPPSTPSKPIPQDVGVESAKPQTPLKTPEKPVESVSEGKGSQGMAVEGKKVSEPPFLEYSREINKGGAGWIKPAVGKKFSAEQIDALSGWLKDRGIHSQVRAGGLRIFGTPESIAKVPDGFSTKRTNARKAADEKFDSDRNAKRSANEKEFSESPASKWIDEIFGKDFANASNKNALARFLESETGSFNGLMSPKWESGIRKLGISTELTGKEMAKQIRGKYAEATTTPGMLESVESAARERLEKRAKGRGTELRSGLRPEDFADLGDFVVIGAAKVAKGTVEFAQWSKEMVKEFGEHIKPHLQQIYDEAVRFKETIAKPLLTKNQSRPTQRTINEIKKTFKEYVDRQPATFRSSAGIDLKKRAAKEGIEVPESTPTIAGKPVTELRDIGSLRTTTATFKRNFEHVFGEETARKIFIDGFDASKASMTDMIFKLTDDLAAEITAPVSKGGLGIGRGTPLSRWVMDFGEKKIEYADLVKKIGKEKADRVKKAEQWFKQKYEMLLEETNATLAEVYPGQEAKLIAKRQDYFRHFSELSESVNILKDMVETATDLPPEMIGLSDFTQPKARLFSIMKRRIGDRSKRDAVGGFLNYLPQAAYVKHITPHIGNLRNMIKELKQATSETRNINNFISWLDNYANHLSGKTSPFDRGVIRLGGENMRKVMNVVEFVTRRVQANTIGLNISSVLAQPFNMVNAAPYLKQKLVRGSVDMVGDIWRTDGPSSKSPFLRERYSSRKFSRFDNQWLRHPIRYTRRFANWMIEASDWVGTVTIWNGALRWAREKGIKNPERYADLFTRDMVGGRGIGERPQIFNEKSLRFATAFQLEVANAMWVGRDVVASKNMGKIATWVLAAYMMNKAVEGIRGNKVGFDPLQAVLDAGDTFIEDDDKLRGALRSGGRLAGEVLSNVPGGQQAAFLVPEKGLFGMTRKELFGAEDPTRFGTGFLAQKAVTDPLHYLFPPFGGNQVRKTVGAIESNEAGEVTDRAGRHMFDAPTESIGKLQALLFGRYATKEAREYFDRREKGEKKNDGELKKRELKKRELKKRTLQKRK